MLPIEMGGNYKEPVRESTSAKMALPSVRAGRNSRLFLQLEELFIFALTKANKRGQHLINLFECVQ